MGVRVRVAVVACILFGLYAVTTGQSVGWEDSAFFQLCHATLGVPHGPGFPLYVLLGRIWTLPFGDYSAWGSNLLSGVFMALAGVVLLEIILGLAGRVFDNPAHHARGWPAAAAAGVILGWGTLEIVWQQAVRTEVYSLTLLLVLTTVFLSLKARDSWAHAPETAVRWSIATAWCFGLAMTVHPLIAAASATPWVFAALSREHLTPRLMLAVVGSALAPMSLYMFPYLRGQIQDAWVWGSFNTVADSLDYFLRRSAWAQVVQIDGGYLENIRGWIHTMPGLWPSILWIPACVGLIWSRCVWPLSLTLAGSAALVLWAAPFDPRNLDLMGYFLPFIAALLISTGLFAYKAIAFLRAQMPGLQRRSQLALGCFSIGLLLGWPTAAVIAAQQRPTAAAGAGEFAMLLTLSLPHHSLLLAADDNLLGMMEYTQRVEGIRPDIRVIAPGALRYSFYRKGRGIDVPAALTELWNDPSPWPKSDWAEAVEQWITHIAGRLPLYSQFDYVPGIDPALMRPAGFLFAVGKATTQTGWKEAGRFWSSASEMAVHDPVARDVVARWMFNFGALAILNGQDHVGWTALTDAVELGDDNPEMYFLLGNALKRAGRTRDARAMYEAAREIAPYRERYVNALQMNSDDMAVTP